MRRVLTASSLCVPTPSRCLAGCAGYCQRGEASGLGVLFLANGEMYKGEFYQNLRHGRGEWRAPREPGRQAGGGLAAKTAHGATLSS